MKCKNCGEEITFLDCRRVVVENGVYDNTGYVDEYKKIDVLSVIFSCPNCNKVLCSTEEDAKKLVQL